MNLLLLLGSATLVGVFVIAYRLQALRLRRQHTLDLQATSRLIDAVLQNAPCGIALLSPDYRYIRINTVLARLNGVPAEATLGRTVEEVLPSLWPRIRAGYVKAVRESRPHIEEYTEERDGRTHYWQSTYYPVISAEGQLLGLGAIVLDVTESKQKQDKLLQVSQDLRKSNMDLERFAYVASHDLKEPLRMITTYLGLLNRELGSSLPEKQRIYMGHALDGGKRLNNLVDSLLRFSRIGTEKMDIQPVAAADVVNEVRESLLPQITECGAQFEVGVLPVVHADRMQLSQLFQNLISNAIKFRRDAHVPVIKIDAETHTGGVTFRITDNGVGIQESDQQRIFEIFRRLHGRSKFPGEGIGLAACKKIVESHGGRIWVKSKPGKGSTFCFTFPDGTAAASVA